MNRVIQVCENNDGVIENCVYENMNSLVSLDAAIDWDAVLWAFGAMLLLWAVGAGVGSLVSVARKLRH